MKKIDANERKSMALPQAKKVLQQEAVAEGLEWTDELDADFSSEVEFLLGLKGRWLLCHMGKSYPYIIRFRLIGEKTYERVKPQEFIRLAKQKLLH